jgi:aryl-alcohol dehydrogenase-like predicted oxidoreductase/histidinol phosphatase-like enzyme
MRLSTAQRRDETHAIAVIHAALDAGATFLDTARAYGYDEDDAGHNERLIAHALDTWRGDASAIEVATKGGVRRPDGKWVPDGRASHLRSACEASRRALGVDAIDLYQLHTVDPRTPLETSVRAMAALQREGMVRRVGLCNVTVGQIEAARRIVAIDAVQVSMSVLDDENIRNGVAEYCRDHGIRIIAYRPLGGDRNARLARDPVLREIGEHHGATPHEIALAWLIDLDPLVRPIPGATRVETARSIARVLAIRLTDGDRARLDARVPAGRLLRAPRTARRPSADAAGEVVLVMGMPGAGKSTVARELVDRGYERLNRDSRGGTIAGLLPELAAALAAGRRRWVLDNTYPSRKQRNEVIECAWQHGVPVRCVWLSTSLPDAQVNAISRLIEVHGHLPMPEELRALGRKDHRYFGPDAQFRFERQLEPPVTDEGFTAVERPPFARHRNPGFCGRAVFLEYDGVLCMSASGAPAALQPDDVTLPPGRAETLARYHADGWRILGIAWRPQISADPSTESTIRACFQRTRQLLGLPLEVACCTHPAGPPICWCRKPLPGLLLEFAHRHRLALDRCTLFGRGPADRTLAARLGLDYREAAA